MILKSYVGISIAAIKGPQTYFLLKRSWKRLEVLIGHDFPENHQEQEICRSDGMLHSIDQFIGEKQYAAAYQH
jgi:hypothetical protein